MEKMDGVIAKTCVEYKEFPQHVNEEVVMKGMIHRIREMTGFAFVIIRTARDVVQCVYSPDFSDYRMDDSVVEGCAVKLAGKIVKDDLIHAYRLAVLTGLRPGELRGLCWGDVKADRLELRLPWRDAGLSAEGDHGILHFQGTRYLGFDRDSTV